MCAIAGLIFDQPRQPSDIERRVRAMCAAQRARGPDSLEVWCDRRVGLGSVRLAIVGSAARGRQPFQGDGGSRLVFNGELYDPAAVMARLGGSFGPEDCDGQALVALLERHGLEGLRDVSAMFALALLEPNGSVLLARDAWGQKPLLVRRGPDNWAFASTVAALQAGTGPLTVRDEAMHECLVYKSVGGRGSAFAGLRQVPPGGWLRIRPDGATEEGCWFELPSIRPDAPCPKMVRQRLQTAIRLRCPERRRPAVFLSGGLDSGIVAAVAAQESAESGKPAPHVFTVGYETGGWRDEHDLAVRLAAQLGLQHETLILRAAAVPGLMRDAAVALEDPVHDPVTVPTLALSRAAARETKVVLTGDGSDEFWGGYVRFDDAPETVAQYLERTTVFQPVELGLTGPPASYLDGVDLPEDTLAPLDRFMRLEACNRLRNYHLSRVDKLSMAVGLEARSPFLDLGVSELALGTSASQKRPAGRPKGLLIDGFSGVLPKWLLQRKKQPFTVPVLSWLSGPLAEFANDTLRGHSFVSGLVDPVRYLDGSRAGISEEGRAMRVWSLLHLEIWYQVFARRMSAKPQA